MSLSHPGYPTDSLGHCNYQFLTNLSNIWICNQQANVRKFRPKNMTIRFDSDELENENSEANEMSFVFRNEMGKRVNYGV